MQKREQLSNPFKNRVKVPLENRELANVLIEALPYIRRFHKSIIVIKLGGSAMNDEKLRREFARDIVLLQYVGVRPVVVHGGGPQINQFLEQLNISSQFIDGHRVTDEAIMEVVEMVLAGKNNKEIVALIQNEGGRAIGISGRDGGLAQAEEYSLEKIEADGRREVISLGRVGRLSAKGIDPSILHTLENNSYISVVAPIAADRTGKAINVNADTMAGAIAAALRAEKLILLTDTEGLLVNGERATMLTPKKVEQLREKGFIQGGMLPKVNCCLEALKGGVKRTHILDGRVAHALLLEIFTNQGVGTMLATEEGLATIEEE